MGKGRLGWLLSVKNKVEFSLDPEREGVRNKNQDEIKGGSMK